MKRRKLFTVAVIVGVLAITYLGSRKIVINKIDCQSQYGPCDEEIVTKINDSTGKPLMQSIGKLKNDLNTHPKVATYSLSFVSPTSLDVVITQRKPQVAVIAEGRAEYHIYSEDGFELGKEKETLLPIINIVDNSVTSRQQMDFVIEMTYALKQTYNVNNITVRSGGMEFEVPNAPKIIFPVQGDIDVLLGSLTFVLSQLNRELGEFRMETVDFRFKNPVIKVSE